MSSTAIQFLEKWPKYFPNAELPIVFWYAENPGDVPYPPTVKGWSCFVAQLAAVRKGNDLAFTTEHVGCGGGKTYLGYGSHLRPNFDHFLSSGIPGELEGERYKKDPETVRQLVAHSPGFTSPEKCLVSKRIDRLAPEDKPEVVAFFATPDTISGLFTLAGFEEVEPMATIAPFSAGCGSVVKYPFLELESGRDWPVIGMFDVSARPYVPANTLTFAVTWPKFERMVKNMDESFLITPSWDLVRRRMEEK